MAKIARPVINSFNGGEVSPRLEGRFDYQRYFNSCRTLENLLILTQGGVMKRPGSYFAYAAKYANRKHRLYGYGFNTVQTYVLEIGHQYIRFYKDGGIILDGAVPYEVATTYTENELFGIQFAPCNDVIYIVHKNHRTRKLTRHDHASWTLENVTFTYDSAVQITGATNANPVVITAPRNDFEAGEEVIITGVGGMTQLNDRLFTVSLPDISAGTFELLSMDGGTGGTAYFVADAGHYLVQVVNGVHSATPGKPSAAITGITNANPVVISCAGHTFVDGEEVKITAVVGTTELNTNTYTVNAAVAGVSISLLGVDSTSYGVYVSGGMVSDTNETASGYGVYTSGGIVSRNPYGGDAKIITGATAANPVVISCTGHGYLAGTKVLIRDVVGMVELNDRIFTVANPAAGSFELSGINGSGYAAYTSGGIVRAKPFTATNEYPAAIAFFEQRMMLARNQTVYGSVSADFENFQLGTKDDDALRYQIVHDQEESILWLMAQDYLMIGTSGGVWRLGASSAGDALTPSNVMAKKQTSCRSLPVEPELVGDSVLYVQQGGRRVRELYYTMDTPDTAGGYRTIDLCTRAQHIAKGATSALSGISDMDYQAEPVPTLWAVRRDGQLLAFVYDKVEQVAGWSRIVTGRDGDEWEKVESVAVISTKYEEDQVWISVKRTISGQPVRYIEYFKPHDFYSAIADYFGVDSGLTFDGGAAVQIVGITNAATAVVTTSGAHGYTTGWKVRIRNVAGMTEVNQGLTSAYTITVVTGTTFQLTGIDSTGWGAYTSGGTVKRVTNTITGLSHLEGRTLEIMIDGARQSPQKTVTAGAVTLSSYGNKIHAGIPFFPVLYPMPVETGAKNIRISRLTVKFLETYGARWGYDADHLLNVPFGAGTDPALFTGDKEREFETPPEHQKDIYITQDGPFPMTVLALTAELEGY